MAGDPTIVRAAGSRESDKDLAFWVPIHKLFSGLGVHRRAGPSLELASHLFNEKLKRFHQLSAGRTVILTQWRGEDLENFPFLIRDEMIGSLSTRPTLAQGLLEPKAQPIVTPASYRDKTALLRRRRDLHLRSVQPGYSSAAGAAAGRRPPSRPTARDAAQSTQRPAPEYSTSAIASCRTARSTTSTSGRT